jgi:hypothetical protein
VLVYTVRTLIADVSTRQSYVDWLINGHAASVVSDGGAVRAEVSTLDDGTVEARYIFASRDAFATYEAGPAVWLRAEGVELFPPSDAIVVTRATGEIRAAFAS